MEITTAASEIGGEKANSRVRKSLRIQETVNSVPSLVGPKWCVMGSQEWVLKKRQQMTQSNHILGGVPFLLTLNRVLFLTTALKLFLGEKVASFAIFLWSPDACLRGVTLAGQMGTYIKDLAPQSNFIWGLCRNNNC